MLQFPELTRSFIKRVSETVTSYPAISFNSPSGGGGKFPKHDSDCYIIELTQRDSGKVFTFVFNLTSVWLIK